MKKQSILPFISKPGRYLGNEFNSVEKKWNQAEVHFALIFPDLYEIGMSHLGLQILYHILNDEADICAERCYCPDIDAEKLMRVKQLPLLTLESATPVSSFDVVGITLPYELCYTNILTIMNLAELPIYSWERSESHPLIIGGGSCSLNPEPVADFFDAILLGDGEEAIVEIAHTIRQAKKNGAAKADIIERLAAVDGIYIPAHFSPSYTSTYTIKSIDKLAGQTTSVNRRIVPDLNRTAHLCNPIVPNAKVVHDRLGVEIARGCTRGCRFCQAGMIYRPVRERSVEQILELAHSGIAHSGFDEIALLSLSTGDHSCIDQLLPQLMDRFADDYVSVSMPSMRVGSLSPDAMDQIKRVRKTGFTLAPEAGSERLRQLINKGISEEELLKTCQDAFTMGWNAIKLYFMLGLPTETYKDVEEIALLTDKIKNIASTTAGKRKQITVSAGTFVPKPHTPFQGEEQLSLAESQERIRHLKKCMPRKSAKLKWHDPEMSFLEGVFSRGDRRLSKLIENAWALGARFDGWSDHFNLTIWQDASQLCDIDLAFYLRERHHDEILPWSHLSSGIDTKFLLDELQKAHQYHYTPDCRYHGCQKCGLCDFEIIKPIVHQNEEGVTTSENTTIPAKGIESVDSVVVHHNYMVNYSRLGDICYLGHLEILQLLLRALRRAKIKPHFSKGFNPSPKISFGGALPVGMESRAEFFIIDLPQPFKDINKIRQLLNDCLPEGLTITKIEPHSGKIPQSVVNSYEIQPPHGLTMSEEETISAFLAQEENFAQRLRKGKTKMINIRPLVKDIVVVNGSTLQLHLTSTAGVPGIKVSELLSHLFSWQEVDILATKMTKISWKPLLPE